VQSGQVAGSPSGNRAGLFQCRDFAKRTQPNPNVDKWLISLGRACFRLLFLRFFRFFADISKTAMRFRLLFTTICKRGALGPGQS
jgi:hypothetical protein